ncbi:MULTISPECIES: hypothetical protein [Thermomonosporaceae]|uniref:hypothetical protein n=1 Tax=Thermomonosporaceae TaxID=2012 RepID=UPI00255ACBFD|nr:MULTISPECIES: hypothetical protein [Thermomonosporaceae]MDL4773326.1 hypothetical protein [Actinomadura xylanilytica]
MDELPQQQSAAPQRPRPAPPSERSLIDDIEARFPGWGAWLSDTFRWWAFRTAAAALTIDQLRAGCSLIVRAGSHAELCAAVRAENARADAARRSVHDAEAPHQPDAPQRAIA